ncbi:hypothetical protein GGQ87_001798 [Brevundimonas alba]|uniref:Uncharacterized protein n=1 Tax=Brevundimonas alba TaxID=74314 RepID=A0A7X6BP96_9CAUL|nr:hypothetical protein [Brevundimonas alba]NJC41540.1 hypothetical protein [Brevundimonas alba]
MAPKWARKLEDQARLSPVDAFNSDIRLIAGAVALSVPLGAGGAKATAWLITTYAGSRGIGASLAILALLALLVVVLTLVGRTFGAKSFAGMFLPVLTLFGVFTVALLLEIFP